MNRKTAPYIIAFHLGWDMADVTEGKYQNTHNPALYVCGEHYYACPTARQSLPHGYAWEFVGAYYGRNVYRAA